MKLLLTDAINPLGRALEHELEREPFGLIVPEEGEVDWGDALAVADYIERKRPDLVVNTLGWADLPDARQCELLSASVGNLGPVCGRLGIPMVQFSSYRVFGADNKSSHSERDDPSPLNDTGRAWLAAERELEAQVQKRVVLRLSWVVGAQGDNLLSRLLEQLFAHRPVVVNARLRGAPTALSDVARVAVGVVKQISCGADNWGVMHYCSSDACSQAEFAERVLEVLKQLDLCPSTASLERLDSVPEDEPVSAVLSCRRLRDNFGVQARAWEPTLVPMVKQWLHEHSGSAHSGEEEEL